MGSDVARERGNRNRIVILSRGWEESRQGWAILDQAELSPRGKMKFLNRKNLWVLPAIAGLGLAWHVANAQEQGQAGKTSYMRGDSTESFSSIMATMTTATPGIENKQTPVLTSRSHITDPPAHH